MSGEIAFGSEKSSGFETRDSNMLKSDLLQNKKNKNETSNEIAYLENGFRFSLKKLRILRRVPFIQDNRCIFKAERAQCFLVHFSMM